MGMYIVQRINALERKNGRELFVTGFFRTFSVFSLRKKCFYCNDINSFAFLLNFQPPPPTSPLFPTTLLYTMAAGTQHAVLGKE